MSENKKSDSWQDTVSDWLISIIVAVVLASDPDFPGGTPIWCPGLP